MDLIQITPSILYDLISCPHRVTMDSFANPKYKDEANPFVQMLWEKGVIYEDELVKNLSLSFLDLSKYELEEKEEKTWEAISKGVDLIYNGRISFGELLGVPDLLRKEGSGYVAIDIKSGAGLDGSEDMMKPKKHYAVQIALYTDILEKRDCAAGRYGYIWDGCGEEVIYDFSETYGVRNPRTLWDDYQDVLDMALAICSKTIVTKPAYSGVCKLCHWFGACTSELEKTDDLTFIPDLGRSKRDVMYDSFPTILSFSKEDPESYIKGSKTVFPGTGPAMLRKYHARAALIKTKDAQPYLTQPIDLPSAETELFFDIEVDPMRDICYMHGFIERTGQDNETEKFVYFFADAPTPKQEMKAFSDAFNYMIRKMPCGIYYYSKYERTIYRKLQQKYPNVCSKEDIEQLFDPVQAVDLYYDVVKKATEWPTRDHSIKTLAKFLGFRWRDSNPSGAASIQWYDQYVKSDDPKIRERIVEYNEDDCIATRVLLDGIRSIQ